MIGNRVTIALLTSFVTDLILQGDYMEIPFELFGDFFKISWVLREDFICSADTE
jgi:hypothetical protein